MLSYGQGNAYISKILITRTWLSHLAHVENIISSITLRSLLLWRCVTVNNGKISPMCQYNNIWTCYNPRTEYIQQKMILHINDWLSMNYKNNRNSRGMRENPHFFSLHDPSVFLWLSRWNLGAATINLLRSVGKNAAWQTSHFLAFSKGLTSINTLCDLCQSAISVTQISWRKSEDFFF